MYTFTFHGCKFDLDMSDWGVGEFTESEHERGIELFSAAMSALSPSVITKAHAEMLKDQADGPCQFDVLNDIAPRSNEYSAVQSCVNNAAIAIFDTWNEWPQSGHNFSVWAI